MDILNPADLKSLIAQQGKWCVSIYMPTQLPGREQQQDTIRLKNLLAEAEVKLLANGLRRPEVRKLMRPAEELLWNSDFWKHLSDGLAIFISNTYSAIYRLPAPFDELLLIGYSVHIKPLLPLLGRGGKYYVLALSLKNVRFFEGAPDTMGEIDLNFPTSMEEAPWMDESVADEEKTNILRFFHFVNQGVNNMSLDKTVPLVLTGVDYLLTIYREVNTYPNLLEECVASSPEREDLNEFREKAWNIARPIFEESQKKAFEKYRQFRGQQTALATDNLETAVKAAQFGQVETLFVPLGIHIWGRYNADNNTVIVEPEQGSENEDLLNFAAAETILNAGQVFAVPRDQMPGEGNLAAVLRYAVSPP
jgi:hypothetical protein